MVWGREFNSKRSNVRTERQGRRVPVVVLAALGTAVTVLSGLNRILRDGLSETLQRPWQVLLDHSWLAYGVVAVLVAIPLCVRFGRRIALWVSNKCLGGRCCHLDQVHAPEDTARWKELICEHRRMLGISLRQMARACGRGIWEMWFLCESPDRLARPELIGPICDVLKTSPDWLLGGDTYGSGHGKNYTIERLLRYDELKVKGITRSEIRNSSELERQTLLTKVEKERRKELALRRGNHE